MQLLRKLEQIQVSALIPLSVRYQIKKHVIFFSLRFHCLSTGNESFPSFIVNHPEFVCYYATDWAKNEVSKLLKMSEYLSGQKYLSIGSQMDVIGNVIGTTICHFN